MSIYRISGHVFVKNINSLDQFYRKRKKIITLKQRTIMYLVLKFSALSLCLVSMYLCIDTFSIDIDISSRSSLLLNIFFLSSSVGRSHTILKSILVTRGCACMFKSSCMYCWIPVFVLWNKIARRPKHLLYHLRFFWLLSVRYRKNKFPSSLIDYNLKRKSLKIT